MASNDTPMPQTDPAAPGHTTSEYALTRVVVIASLAISAVFGVLSQIEASGLVPGSSQLGGYLATAISVVALLSALTKAIRYTDGRVDLKKTLAEANLKSILAALTKQPEPAPAAQPAVVPTTPEAKAAAAEVNAALGGGAK